MAQERSGMGVDRASPEFRQAVTEAATTLVEEKMSGFEKTIEATVNARLEAQLAELKNAAGIATSGDDKSWVQSLAMALSELSDQGQHKFRVAPHVIAQRAEAREKMVQLIMQARAEGRAAEYIVMAKCYLGFQLVEPKFIARDRSLHDTVIEWDNVPNEALRPVNDTAKAIYAAFKDSIGIAAYKPPEDRYGVTRGGLVVKGAAGDAANRGMRVANTILSGGGVDFGSGLNVKHADTNPRLQPVNILGDIAKPAQRMS